MPRAIGFKQNLRHVDPDAHVAYQIELKPTSAELGAIFEPRRGLLVANDTSAGVGYAPLTPTERLVIDVEHYLNGPLFKAEFPETGEDIKVMAIRLREQLSLTLAIPLLAAAVPNAAAYFRQKSRITQALQEFVQKRPHGCKRIRLVVNALDRQGKGLAGMYLTLLGTSAEQGDSGQIGRGNRVCGVIPLSRPTSGEAAAGKNPVSHVGKIYNVLAHDLASRIHQQVPGVCERQPCSYAVPLVSGIDRPAIAVAELSLGKGVSLPRVQKRVHTIIQDGLKGLGDVLRGTGTR